MYCPKCGHQNPDDARFCMQCRADLAALRPAVVESPAASNPAARQNSARPALWKPMVAVLVVMAVLLGGWLVLSGTRGHEVAAVAAPTAAPAAVPNAPAYSGTNPGASNAVVSYTSSPAISPVNIQRLREWRTFKTGGWVESLSFSPRQPLAVWCGNWGCQVYDFYQDRPMIRLPGYTINAVFGASGDRLYSGGAEQMGGKIHAWDVKTGAELWSTVAAPAGSGAKIAVSPDEHWLASSGGGALTLWQLGASGLQRYRQLSSSNADTPAFSPDGKWLAFWEGGRGVRIIGIPDGPSLFAASTSQGYNVAFSPDSMTVAGGAEDGGVRLWQLPNGTMVRTLTGHSGLVNKVAFSPAGALLASISRDGTVRLWEVFGGQLLSTLGVGQQGNAVGFSADGTVLATGAQDGTLKLWRVQ